MKELKYFSIFFIALLASSCSSSDSAEQSEATANVHISIPALKSQSVNYQKQNTVVASKSQVNTAVPAEVDSIVISIVDENQVILDSGDILQSNGEITLSIVAGSNYTAIGEAFASGELLFYDEVNIPSITAGQTLSLDMSLLEQVVLDLTSLGDLPLSAGTSAVDLNVSGLNDVTVNWYVNGVLGGSSEFGFIDAQGQYTPPATLPVNTLITVTAEPVVAPSFAESFQFTLLPAVNQAPVANAGIDVVVNAGVLVTLDATNSTDADGTIVSYSWSRVSGDFNPSISNASSSIASFTAPSLQFGGSATFRVIVTDNVGATSTDEVIITVSGTDQPLIADAGVAQTVTEGDLVTLNASASADPDNTITSYSWQQTGGQIVTLSNATSVSPTFTAPPVAVSGEDFVFEVTVTNDALLQDTATVTIHVNDTIVSSNNVYFGATSTGGSIFLWKSDGTAVGTQQVASVSFDNTQLHDFNTVGGKFYFSANDGSNGIELWRTDGTGAGTEMLPVAADADYQNGGASANSNPNNQVVLGDRLLFNAFTSNDFTFNYPEFLSLDTTASPVNLTDFTVIHPESANGGFTENQVTAVMGGFVYFTHSVYSPAVVHSLYRTDGVNPSELVFSGFSDSSIVDMTVINNELYFTVGFNELWKTDGTTTTLIKTFATHVGYFPNGSISYFYLGGLVGFNNQLFFVADDGQSSELWVSDGTPTGTVLVLDLDANTSTSSFPAEFRVVNNRVVFFSAEGGAATDGVWVTDGTPGGTTRLAAVSVGHNDSGYAGSGFDIPRPVLVSIGGQDKLFFVGNDGSNGTELWVTDGTPAGTQMVSNIHPTGNSFPAMFRSGVDMLIFSAQDADGRAKLWRTDGTSAGTSLILDICPSCFGQSTFFGFFGG